MVSDHPGISLRTVTVIHVSPCLYLNYKPGPEVIKLEYSLKLKKIKRNDWLLTDIRKQPIIALYFEFENDLKFYNLGAWFGMRDAIPYVDVAK